MLKRTITGIVAALFAVGVLAFRDTPALSIVVAIFTVIAAREIEKVIGIKNKAIYYISLAFSGLVPLFYEFRPELEQRGIVIPVTAVVVIYCVVLFMLMLTDFEIQSSRRLPRSLFRQPLFRGAFRRSFS